MGLDLNAFLDEFRTEAVEHLRALDTQLLALERDPDDHTPIRAMFLAAHSLKGAGAMMDLADVEALAHGMEDVLVRLRDGQQRLDSPTADRLFRAIDLLAERIARAIPGAAPVDAPIETLVAELASLHTTEQVVLPGMDSTTPDLGIGGGPVALLIEDSPTVRFLHAALLAEAGFAVDLATEGQEALVLAGTRHYDLIVSGLETRGLRGPELAAALHERAAGQMPPFVLMHHDDADWPDRPEPGIALRLPTAAFGQQHLLATARDLLARAMRA